ncbi:MAG: exonuclease domain-containing protein [Microcella sp.]
MSIPGFAVVDVETTGLFPGGSDRVIELAVVTTDEFGTVTDDWETVVNPRRHIGAGHVHGLDGATLLSAPAFADMQKTTCTPRVSDEVSQRGKRAHSHERVTPEAMLWADELNLSWNDLLRVGMTRARCARTVLRRPGTPWRAAGDRIHVPYRAVGRFLGGAGPAMSAAREMVNTQ